MNAQLMESAPPVIPDGGLPNLFVLNGADSALPTPAHGVGLVHTQQTPCLSVCVDQSGAMPPMGFEYPGTKPCRIVVFYENQESKERADQLCENVRRLFSEDLAFQVSRWKLSILREHSIQSLAVDDAREADVILVALENGGDVDRELEQFNRLWSSQRNGSGILAVQLNETLDENNEWLRKYFQRLSKGAGLDFLFAAAEFDSLPQPQDLAAAARHGLARFKTLRN